MRGNVLFGIVMVFGCVSFVYGTASAMGRPDVSLSVEGEGMNLRIIASVRIDCEGCIWSETATLSGTVKLYKPGSDRPDKTSPLSKSISVPNGENTNKDIEVWNISIPNPYGRAEVYVKVSGPDGVHTVSDSAERSFNIPLLPSR